MSNISYVDVGVGDVILFLHGWGQNKEMMIPLIEELKYRYRCVIIDMPGFGKSAFNGEKDLNEYTKNIRKFLESKQIYPKHIVGHSFGGKVAVNYYFNYKDIQSLIIIASPLLKPKKSLKYYFNVYKYKLKKKLNKNTKNEGSLDYRKCSKEMKSFFVKIVNTHFDKNIIKIEVPVLLIWGKNDEKVPLKKAKKHGKKIIDSELCVEKGGHYAYLENIQFTRLIMQKFLRRKIND